VTYLETIDVLYACAKSFDFLRFLPTRREKTKSLFLKHTSGEALPPLKVRRLLYHKHEKGNTTNYVAKYFFTAGDKYFECRRRMLCD